MDFFVREARVVADEGPMLIVRYGSCGGVSAAAVPATVVVNTSGSVAVREDYDALSDDLADAEQEVPRLPGFFVFHTVPCARSLFRVLSPPARPLCDPR